MSEDRAPLESLLDVFVFAPIGAALHGTEAVETLAAKGRQDVANARVIGRLAIRRGRTEAVRLSGEVQEALGDLLVAAARAAGAPMAGATEEPPAPDDTRHEGGPTAAPPHPPHEDGAHLTVVADAAPPADDLAIPDYDNLSASQVVPRLDDLAAEELAAVQAYERAHRGRMTILSRIAQLQAS